MKHVKSVALVVMMLAAIAVPSANANVVAMETVSVVIMDTVVISGQAGAVLN